MSGVNAEEAVDMTMCCASCGKAEEVDDVKLKICTGCKLVRYCSVECQKNHRPKHKKACKKRAAELREDRLFAQPDESHWGECPICCLPLPTDNKKSMINTCCCKLICVGCAYANKKREWEAGLERRCPYCREPAPKTDEEADQNLMERAKANDPEAIFKLGVKCYEEGDYSGAFEDFTKAAALGSMNAHYNLSLMYYKGEGVEKDMKKYVSHLKEAAIRGHPNARHNLGCLEAENGRFERAMKHFIIAANLGYDVSLKAIKKLYADEKASKEDYAAALRAYQATVDATKSPERDEAARYREAIRYHRV